MLTRDFKALLFAISCIFCVQSARAIEQVDGQYVWNFASGEPWPSGYNQNTGKPDDLVYARNEYPTGFFERINNALPEAQVNEAFLTGDAGSNIHLTEEAEVFVTFIHEGAGYKNSFGFFTFDRDNPPSSPEEIQETILFPNLSYPHLTNGHRLSLGTFPAGTSIGFFIAANGFWYYTGVKPFAVPYYYSLKDLNPDPTDILRQHNVLLFDSEISEVIIGFEDLPRTWGDNDFNDAVFSVKSSPASAIESTNLVPVPDVNDSDADGINDEEDEFPEDYRRAYSAYYPSQNDWVTLAYEDNWPNMGDYDMNDLVVRERLQTTYNANGEISGFKITGFIDARGAANHNGFSVRLMGLTPDIIDEGTITIDGSTHERSPEQWQSEAVINFWLDSHVYTNTGEEGSCSHFNTKADCPRFDPIPFELDIYFAYAPESLNHSSLDFFIFRTDYRGREIHLANYAPTDLFDESQFGRFDDTSNPVTNRYFKNSNNLPWALRVDTNWCHPREYIDIVWAYPDYENWVESSGANASNWYRTSARNNHYVCRDDNEFEPEVSSAPNSYLGILACNITSFNQIDSAYEINVDVENISDADIHSWQVQLEFDQNVTLIDSWESNITTQENLVTAGDANWNGLILPNQTRSFGFQVSSESALSTPTCSIE